MSQMDYNFQVHQQTRKNFLSLIEGYSLAQLNKVPDGFKNNLIWNFGHVICTQQLLCYKVAGIDPVIPMEIIDRYRKGTVPQANVDQRELDILKELAINTVIKMEEDYKSGLFKSYNPYETSYGIQLNSIEEAMMFNNVHEGMHYGYALALRKHL